MNSILASKALYVYLSHQLEAALNFRERLNNYCAADFLDPSGGGSSRKILDELVLYLEESIGKPMSLHVLASRLAVIERLKKSSTWTLLDDTHQREPWERREETWGSAEQLNKLSADFLRASIAAEECNEMELTRECRFVSHLADMAVDTAQQKSASYLLQRAFSLPGYHQKVGDLDNKITICRYVVDMLASFPTAILDCGNQVRSRYQRKVEDLEEIRKKLTELKQDIGRPSRSTDVRLLYLSMWRRAIMRHSIAQLSDCGPDPAQVVEQHHFREERLSQIVALQASMSTTLRLLDKCRGLLTEVTQRDAKEPHLWFALLCGKRNVVLRLTRQAYREDGLAGSALDVELLLSDAADFLQRVEIFEKSLGKTVRVQRLVSFYTAEGVKAAKVRPLTQYQQKLVECWEKAAETTPADSGERSDHHTVLHHKFAALAEGVFASAATCHTQSERAVQRKDDKLADFWQRTRERAWAVGCKAFGASYVDRYVWRAAERIVKGVKAGLQAQELGANPDAHPLAGAEGDLRFLLADALVAYDSGSKDSPRQRELIRSAAEQTLELMTSLHPSAQLCLLDIIPKIAVSESACKALRQVVQVLRNLHLLSRVGVVDSLPPTFSSDVSEAWRRGLYQVMTAIAELRDDIEGFNSVLIAQRMFLAALTVKALHADHQRNPIRAFWYRLLDARYAAVMPDDALLKSLAEPTRSETVNLRLCLASALEEEVKRSDAEAALWLQETWQPERRGFPQSTATCSAHQTETIACIVASIREAQRWKHQARDCADTAMRSHLESGAEVFVTLAETKRKAMEHGQHGTYELCAYYDKRSGAALLAMAEGLERTVKGMQLGLLALQARKKQAHATCNALCKNLTVITNDASVGRSCAEKALQQVLLCADHTLNAVTAELEGHADRARAWRAAVQARESALDRQQLYNVAATLKLGQERTLHHADALAEQARRLGRASKSSQLSQTSKASQTSRSPSKSNQPRQQLSGASKAGSKPSKSSNPQAGRKSV